MVGGRRAATRLLLVLLVASVVLPAVLLAFAAWTSHRSIARDTDERIDRSLDILHEHALKVIQTVERTFGEIDEITRGLSDLDIRLNERSLHERLARIVRDLPQLQGIAIIDRDGGPLVSSNTMPVPEGLNLADRTYFRSQADAYPGTFVSGLLKPRMSGLTGHFFTLTRRRASIDGTFNGIVSIAVRPSSFATFYTRMAQGQVQSQGSYFALARDDGGFLARVPVLRDPERKLDANSPLRAGIAQGFDRAIYTVKSQLDNVTRRIGYRKVTGFPLYVMAGVDEGVINGQWFGYLRSQLMFGVPATVFLFAGLMLAYRRTQRLYDEAERREAAEDALRQSQRLEAIGQLTGGVAHDFNNLLMIISGSVQRLRNELTDQKHRRLLDMIVTATQRGETLTRQLLTYSRRQTLSPQVMDLSQRLPAIRELLTRSLRTDIEIKVEVPDGPCAVRVDPGEFELAILNLAVNAKDAMPNGGSLTIRVRPVTLKGEASEEGLAGDFAAVRVADTGQGIPAEVVARVFEPFFTTKEVGKGTGLGLSQVYGFAKQSGGTATVTSTEGRGTAVTLYLPRTHEAAPVVAPAAPVQAEPEAAGTVLLVEDNADVAEVGAGYMRHLGYRVRSVANVQAALAALRLDPQVDLVFSDILMPGGRNGLDLAREVMQRYPHLPVLLTTGYSASAQEAVRSGVTVLQKPYDLEALRRHISEAVERKKMQDLIDS